MDSDSDSSPVSRLHAELLGHIFHLTCTDAKSECRTRFNFSQVSHHWRSIALGTPLLWVVLNVYHPQFAMAMLQRSHTAVLTLEADLALPHRPKSEPETVAFLSHVLSDDAAAPRVRDVRLSGLGPNAQLADILSGVRDRSLHLRDLRLSARPFSSQTFPMAVLDRTDELEYLEAIQCSLLWPASGVWSFPRLRQFRLLFIYDHLPDLAHFVHILQQMPLLEVLDIKYSLPKSGPSPIALTPARLPSLKSINVHTSDLLTLSEFVRSLSIPPSASIHFDTYEGREENRVSERRHFASSLSTFFSAINSDPDLGNLSYKSLTFQTSEALYMSFRRSDGKHDTIALRQLDRNLMLLESILPSIPVHDLNQLKLCIPLPGRTLANTFGALDHLRHLEFSRPLDFRTSISILANTSAVPLRFPALRVLSFIDMTRIEFDDVAHTFLDWLTRRRQCRRGIERLIFHPRCHPGPSQASLERLKEVVDIVDFQSRVFSLH